MVLLSLTISLFFSSCSISKSARVDRKTINGSWTLDNISYENASGNFSSVIFNDAKDICFEGSSWFFRNNNSTGTYTIPNTSLCSAGDRYIRWSVVEAASGVSQLQFKFTDEKKNDVSGGLGYRLDIANLTETEMILKSNVTANGSPVTVVYEFTKNQ